MIGKRIFVALGCFGLLFLSGCTGETIENSGIRSGYQIGEFGNYTWNAPVFTDSNGTLLESHPVFGDPLTAPRVIYQLLPDAGAEPSLGVTKAGNVFFGTFDKVQVSSDYGRSWKVIYEYTSPTQDDQFQTLDPMMHVDPDTDWIFNTHLAVGQANVPFLGGPWCIYLAKSKDEGKTWSDQSGSLGPARMPGAEACLVGISDHQKIATAKPGPKTGDAAKQEHAMNPNKYQNVLYYCHQKYQFISLDGIIGPLPPPVPPLPGTGNLNQNPVYGTWCETSFDAGLTWTYSTQISEFRDGCPAGINGKPGVWPDGTVGVPLGTFGDECGKNPPAVVVSEDSGRSWIRRTSPDKLIGQMEIDPDITVTQDGVAYLSFRGKDQHLYLYRSPDKFVTWEGPWRVSPPDQTMNVFNAIVGGDDGRIAVAYLGTRDAQEKEANPSNATGGTAWHAFVSYSFDANTAEPTFYTVQVTPNEDPAQVGCVWLKGGGGGPKRCRNLLDFIDAVVDKDGRVLVAITDGCTPRNGCAGDTESANYQSHDSDGAILVQDSGLSLFGENGVLPRIGLAAPQPIPR